MFGIFLNRKNVIIILMSIELILLAVNINLVAFSAALGDLVGQVFAMFVLTVAAAEAAIGLAIVVVYFRNRGSIQVEDVDSDAGLSRCCYASRCSRRCWARPIAGLFGRLIGDRASHGVTILCMIVAAPAGSPRSSHSSAAGAAGVADRHLDRGRPLPRRMGAAVRHALGGDGGDGHHRLDADPHLSVGYMAHEHTRRSRFFCYCQPVHLRDADAGDVRQHRAAVLRLGRCRASCRTC